MRKRLLLNRTSIIKQQLLKSNTRKNNILTLTNKNIIQLFCHFATPLANVVVARYQYLTEGATIPAWSKIAGFWKSLKIQIEGFWKRFQISIEHNSKNII